MTDERLKALEATCSAAAAGGRVNVDAADVLDLVRELRELRKHASDLSAHQGAIANLQLLLMNLTAYVESGPQDDEEGSGRIAVQDPGR